MFVYYDSVFIKGTINGVENQWWCETFQNGVVGRVPFDLSISISRVRLFFWTRWLLRRSFSVLSKTFKTAMRGQFVLHGCVGFVNSQGQTVTGYRQNTILSDSPLTDDQNRYLNSSHRAVKMIHTMILSKIND